MPFNIDNFKSTVTGIQRPSLFEVYVTGAPVIGSFSTQNFVFTCKSAQVPASNIGVIPVPYMGRKINFNGDRNYEEWSTTIFIDNKWNTYKDIFNWHQAMNGAQSNIASTGNMNNLKGTANLKVYSQEGNVNLNIKLVGFWPSSIQAIEMAWDNNDAMTEATVTWQYDYALLV